MLAIRLLLSAAVLNLTAVSASAHDFWLQPADLTPDASGTVPITMFVGHGADRSHWGVDVHHVDQFRKIGPEGEAELRALLQKHDVATVQVPFEAPGAHIVVLQSRWSESSLEAGKFNDYVADEGITPISDYRSANQLTEAAGKELYSRRAKTIVQLGPVTDADSVRVTAPIGALLEIVPKRHPLQLGSGDILPVQVLYEGEPLAGALVKLTDLDADTERTAELRTDASGIANFVIPHTGRWQMHVIWAKKLADNPRGDFDTTFSSLTFASG